MALFINESERVLTIDSYPIMEALSKIDKSPRDKIIIWVHYFKGHSRLFSQYRQERKVLTGHARFSDSAISMLPPKLYDLGVKNYLKTLKKGTVIAQSIWTCLLVNRVYNVKCQGIVPVPIDEEEYSSIRNCQKDPQYLIFLGNYGDTKLTETVELVKWVKTEFSSLRAHSFGSSELSGRLSELSGVEIQYHGKVPKKELIELYAKSLFTVSPIYNGNFEMVPIESILSGTPVVTYYQPFMEITGNFHGVANLNNISEAKRLIEETLHSERMDDMGIMQQRISSEMNYLKVAGKLADLLESTRL